MSTKISVCMNAGKELYMNENGNYFGRDGKHHFRINETQIIPCDMDDLKELKAWTSWKFAKTTRIINENEFEFELFFDHLDEVLIKYGLDHI